MKTIKLYILLTILFSVQAAAQSIQVSTWNIEHLGSPGRGFGGGFGSGELPLRTDNQLNDIADLIHELGTDIIALQEIAITHYESGKAKSRQLDHIVKRLGAGWKYYLPPSPNQEKMEMVCGYLWNTTFVDVLSVFPMPLPNYEMKGLPIFDRKPIVAYVQTQGGFENNNDMVLVNIHLKSGQTNDENHLVAMVFIEQELNGFLKGAGIKESDKVILGDFNDNPYLVKPNGKPAYLSTMYEYMGKKGYKDIVAPDLSGIQYTRMNDKLNSVIDHILVNRSMGKHVAGTAEIYYPPGAPETYADWRRTYSDHFPITYTVSVSMDDDAD